MTSAIDTSRMGLDTAAAAAADFLPKARVKVDQGIDTVSKYLNMVANFKIDTNSKFFIQASNAAFVALSIFAAISNSLIFFVTMACGIIFKAKLVEVQDKLKEVSDKTINFFNLPPVAQVFTALGLVYTVTALPTAFVLGASALWTGAAFGMYVSKA